MDEAKSNDHSRREFLKRISAAVAASGLDGVPQAVNALVEAAAPMAVKRIAGPELAALVQRMAVLGNCDSSQHFYTASADDARPRHYYLNDEMPVSLASLLQPVMDSQQLFPQDNSNYSAAVAKVFTHHVLQSLKADLENIAERERIARFVEG